MCARARSNMRISQVIILFLSCERSCFRVLSCLASSSLECLYDDGTVESVLHVMMVMMAMRRRKRRQKMWKQKRMKTMIIMVRTFICSALYCANVCVDFYKFPYND